MIQVGQLHIRCETGWERLPLCRSGEVFWKQVRRPHGTWHGHQPMVWSGVRREVSLRSELPKREAEGLEGREKGVCGGRRETVFLRLLGLTTEEVWDEPLASSRGGAIFTGSWGLLKSPVQQQEAEGSTIRSVDVPTNAPRHWQREKCLGEVFVSKRADLYLIAAKRASQAGSRDSVSKLEVVLQRDVDAEEDENEDATGWAQAQMEI